MTDPIETIRIYNPQGKAYYSDAEKTSVEFPITNSCERSAKLMGDDYVRLVFKLPNKVVFDTYAFIEYDGQTFFLKETYRPTPNGCLKETIDGKESVSSAYYSYDVKFVSIANMLTKPICYRHVVVKGAGGEQHVWDEPEISINGTLETLYQIIIGSIEQAANRLPASHYKEMLASIATNGKFTNGAKPDGVQLTPNTKLVSFSFSGDNIANVCTSVANSYTEDSKDTEWFITEDASHNCTLHFAKCESADTAQVLSDYEWENNGTDRFARPYLNGGLKSVEYAQAWSDVPQVIVPYGADRNMSGISVVGIDETTQMQSTFGKRLRLDPNTTYNVHDKNGENAATITTDAHGALSNPNVNTGIEITKFYDDIYPQCHFKITKVEVKNKRQSGETVPEYTCEGIAVDARYTKEYLAQKGMFPLRIEEATTLSVRFESGFLNGREFEIANKTHKDQGSTGYSLKFTIVADGSIEDGTLIPSGNFKPNVGDQFALFNMKMPAEFVSLAKQDLAQRAYEELLDLQNTRPEVKCTSEPFTFMQHTVSFGAIMQVSSELFGDEPLVSRVIAYSYKLTSPSSVQFSLASAVMQGTLSEMNNAISDVTHTAGGLEQRAINLSRRGWRDANEVADMLDSITSEMMLVGNERYQFGFTSSIECVDSGNKFASLRVGYGSLQHTQEPYINYANKGLWEISGATLTKDVNGANLDPNTPYYLFAQVADDTNPARLILTTDAHKSESEDDVPYLLLGILSSEFEDRRVFSRTHGYTAIEGGTITTEQIQDASRNLIIDFQSNPPRIIARNGAEIIGNVRFKASDTKTAEQQLRDLGFDVEDAKWLNLYAGGDLSLNYLSAGFPIHKGLIQGLPEGTYKTAITSESNGKDGSVAFDGFENSCLVWFKAGAGNGHDVNDVLQGHKDEILAISNWGEDVTINESADVVVYTCIREVLQSVINGANPSEFPASGTWTINGIQIMGLVSATAINALNTAQGAQDGVDGLDYLKKAIAKGTTQVSGGLLLTNVLMLKDENNKITAGMSGMTGTTDNPEKVLLWGGGDYNDATNAAADTTGEYKKVNGTPITTLLKKDGTGKIGIFKISDTQAVIDVPNQGKVVIDASNDNGGIFIKDSSGVDKVVVTPNSVSAYKPVDNGLSSSKNTSDSIDFTGRNFTSSIKPLVSGTIRNFNTLISVTQYDGGTEAAEFQYTIEIIVNRSVVKQATGTWTTESGEKLTRNINNTFQDFAVTKNSEFTVRFGLLINTLDSSDTREVVITIKTAGEVTVGGSKTVIGLDGLISIYSDSRYFMVDNSGDTQNIIAKGLTADSGTAGDGSLYKSQNIIWAFEKLITTLKNIVNGVRSVGNNSSNATAWKAELDKAYNLIKEAGIIASS